MNNKKYDFFLSKLKLLYIEDDLIIQENLSKTLSMFFKEIFISNNNNDSLEILKNNDIDIVISDILLEDENSLDMINIIREKNINIPIIITTAHLSQEYLKKSLNVFVFDYLIKPFSFSEIFESIKKCIDNIFINSRFFLFDNDIIYDIKEEILYNNNKPIELSKFENSLLKLLSKKYGFVVQLDEIAEYVYGDEYPSFNAIKMLVSKLRNKVGKKSILNYSNIGYKLRD